MSGAPDHPGRVVVARGQCGRLTDASARKLLQNDGGYVFGAVPGGLQDRGGEAERAAVMPRLQDSRQAHGQFRDLGVPFGQATASNELGLLQQLTGNNPAAASNHQALQLYRDVGNWHGQAEALNNLGGLRSLI